MNSRPDAQQPTNDEHIFRANASAIMEVPSAALKTGSGVAGIGVFFWAVTLPLSLLGSVVKSTVDVNTRKKMSEAELNTTIDNIAALNDEKFDQFVSKISDYKAKAKSSSSREIFTQLDSAKQKLRNELKECELKEEEAIEQQRISDVNKGLENFYSTKPYDGGTNFITTFKLSDQDKTDAKETARKLIPQLVNAKRNAIKEKIIFFMKEPYNAGKKLQHVIKDAAEETKNVL